MKRMILGSLLAVGFFSIGCEKETKGVCVKVKVVAEICGQVVLQIQDPSKYYLGESGYDYRGKIYNNVFYTEDNCNDPLPLSNTTRDSLFFVRIVEPNSSDTSCVNCRAALQSRPQKAYHVSVKSACNNQ